jgi:hypothetical protein
MKLSVGALHKTFSSKRDFRENRLSELYFTYGRRWICNRTIHIYGQISAKFDTEDPARNAIEHLLVS